MYMKSTLRKMSPTQRKFAKAANGVELHLNRLKRMVDEIGQLEQDSRALEGSMPKARPRNGM